MGRGDAQNAKFIPLLAAHEHPMLTVDVGLGVEAGETAGIHPAHPFFGLANVLKSRCITERKVSSIDFDNGIIVFDTAEHDTMTVPTEAGVVGTFSLSAAPFHSVGLPLASELSAFVKGDGMMKALGLPAQCGTAVLSGHYCIELRGDGDGKLNVISFDPSPTIEPSVQKTWSTSWRRLEWTALNRVNNAVTSAYISCFDEPDDQIRPVVRAATRQSREIAMFPSLPYSLPGLRAAETTPAKGIWTVAILVPSGALSPACISRVVALHNIIAVEHKKHVGIVIREDSDSYRQTMSDLSDRVDVLHLDIDAFGSCEELIVELAPFVGKGVAISNSPTVIKAMNDFDPTGEEDDGEDRQVDDCDAKATFTSPLDWPDLTIKAHFVGEFPLVLEVAGTAGVALQKAMLEVPALLSIHVPNKTIMRLDKVVRDAALIGFLKEGHAAFHASVKTELSKVLFKRGRPGQFGAIRLEQKDAALIAGCSQGFVSAFLTDATPDWGDKCHSLALNLSYFAYRVKLTPTDPTAGLSEEIHSQLPSAEDMADKAAKKQKGDLGPAVCGGAGSAQPAAKDVTPRSFQGNDEHTVAMRTYLINCTLRKCDANLPHIMQDRMCRVLWRIENGLEAHTADPPAPTMCPESSSHDSAHPDDAVRGANE